MTGYGHHIPEGRPAKKKPRGSRRSAPGQHNDDAEPLMDAMQAAYERDHPGAGVTPQWDKIREKADAIESQLAALKAAQARGATAEAGSAGYLAHAMPPGSPADERDMARAGVFDQQPASLPGGIRETLSQDYLKANFNRGEVTVQHMDLRAAAGAYGGQQQVGADAMSRAVEMSHLIPSSRSAGYPAAQGLTGLAPGESR